MSRPGLVLDIETRVDGAAFVAAGRRGAARGLPQGLQTIAAAAMLSFDVDEQGLCGGMRMTSLDRSTAGESALVLSVERRLAKLADDGGTLITFNGGHDLSILRLASLRHRHFETAASARWMLDATDAHDDLMLDLSGWAPERWPRLADLTASLGIVSRRDLAAAVAELPRERMKCELDVVATMAVYLHVLAERHGSREPLAHGVRELDRLIHERLGFSPHLAAVQRGALLSSLAPIPF